jgi:hypothetical protein
MNPPSSEDERQFWRQLIWGVPLGAGLGWLFWAVFLGAASGGAMWMCVGWGALIGGLLAGWFGSVFVDFLVRLFVEWL